MNVSLRDTVRYRLSQAVPAGQVQFVAEEFIPGFRVAAPDSNPGLQMNVSLRDTVRYRLSQAVPAGQVQFVAEEFIPGFRV